MLNKNPVLVGDDAKDTALLPFVFAGDHFYPIVTFKS